MRWVFCFVLFCFLGGGFVLVLISQHTLASSGHYLNFAVFFCLCVQSVCSQSAAGKDHPHHQRSDQHHLQRDPQSLCSGNIEHHFLGSDEQTVGVNCIREMCSISEWQTGFDLLITSMKSSNSQIQGETVGTGSCCSCWLSVNWSLSTPCLLFDFLYCWERNVQTDVPTCWQLQLTYQSTHVNEF